MIENQGGKMSILKLHGAHLKHHKNTARMAPEKMTIPEIVFIPMSMHIGPFISQFKSQK